MHPALGEVKGDCPHCHEPLEIEGEFSTHTEFEHSCGAVLVISEIFAVYTVRAEVIALPEDNRRADRESLADKTSREDRMERREVDGKCTYCPPHGGENATRYGRHSDHGQKPKRKDKR